MTNAIAGATEFVGNGGTAAVRTLAWQGARIGRTVVTAPSRTRVAITVARTRIANHGVMCAAITVESRNAAAAFMRGLVATRAAAAQVVDDAGTAYMRTVAEMRGQAFADPFFGLGIATKSVVDTVGNFRALRRARLFDDLGPEADAIFRALDDIAPGGRFRGEPFGLSANRRRESR